MTSPLPHAATVPAHFLHGMVQHVRARHGETTTARLLADAAVPATLLGQQEARLTRAQYAALYRLVAASLDDEMLGLWSRPIRTGTLKYLMLSILDAPNVLVALHRLARFWNLLLDDYRMHLSSRNGQVRLALLERAPGMPLTPLGHVLMMKLVHGIAAWLPASGIALDRVEFAFACPGPVQDYATLFPGEVRFGAAATAVCFGYDGCMAPCRREKHELWAFLKRAPEEWTFGSGHRASMSARVREHVGRHLGAALTIDAVAKALHTSVRTLNRRLAEEGTTFHAARNALRRDMAVHRLTNSNTGMAALAFELGFADASGFCRAFRQWTGSSPSDYRQASRRDGQGA